MELMLGSFGDPAFSAAVQQLMDLPDELERQLNATTRAYVRDRRAMANTYAHGRQGAAVRADRPGRRHARGQPLRRQGPGGGGQRAPLRGRRTYQPNTVYYAIDLSASESSWVLWLSGIDQLQTLNSCSSSSVVVCVHSDVRKPGKPHSSILSGIQVGDFFSQLN